jgi:hypothetical protein
MAIAEVVVRLAVMGLRGNRLAAAAAVAPVPVSVGA